MKEAIIERAKQVVAEIVQQHAGDEMLGAVRLYKAFYFAHLYYAKKNVGYLTEWPIVKMPMGPGIGDFQDLTQELISDGFIKISAGHVGPLKAQKYRAVKRAEGLEPEAVEAIREAVEFVSGKTGAQLSDITHEFSRSWREASIGDELSIYVDLLSDEDYEREKQRAELIEDQITQAWSD